MKSIKMIIIIFLLSIIIPINVYAKDTVYSINNYKDSEFKYIEKAYDKDLKSDGYVLGGNFLKEEIEKDDDTYNDYQVILVKYNKYDKLSWKYTYGLTKEDYIDYLTYSYNEEGKIDGYLIVLKKTYNIEEAMNDTNSTVIKVDLDGKLVYEKDINEGIITKIIPTMINDSIDGYISSVNTSNGTSLIKYNKNLDVVWRRDFNDTTISDITIIKEDNKIIGYILIQGNNLTKLDLDGNNDIILEDITKYYSKHLEEASNGFIFYGVTDEVKLKQGDYSYILIRYNSSLEKEEILGDTAISEDYDVKALFIKDEYFLLYKNNQDFSYEVIKIDKDGLVNNKVKKIVNNYYDFTNFSTDSKTIYFIGQINCPEDEKCDYDNRSLYLVSDEDKVIEVKDKETTGVLIFMGGFILLVGILVFISRKRKLSK